MDRGDQGGRPAFHPSHATPPGNSTRALSNAHSRSEDDRVRAWQRDVVENIAERATPVAQETSVIVNNVTTPAVHVSLVPCESKTENDISTKAIKGTILEASAGADITYSMAKREKGSTPSPELRRVTYRKIETTGQRSTDKAGVLQPPCTVVRGLQPQGTATREVERPRSKHDFFGPRASTVLPQPHPDCIPQSSIVRSIPPDARSHAGSGQKVIARTNGTTVLTGGPPHSLPSHPLESVESVRYPPSLETKSAKGVPLPQSLAPTAVPREREMDDLSTVVPGDSISQISSNGPKHYRSKHHSTSRLAKEKTHSRFDSHTSHTNDKGHSRRHSLGRHRSGRADSKTRGRRDGHSLMMGIPFRPASKTNSKRE